MEDEFIAIMLKRKRHALSGIPQIIPFTAEVYDLETLEQLYEFWLYVNAKKFETDNGQIKTNLKLGRTSIIEYYAIPTEDNQFFYVPEKYHLTPTRITKLTFSIQLTATDENGNPLQNATVTVEYNGSSTDYQTDENGAVTIPDLPRQTDITITITKDDYSQKTIIYVK